MSCLVSFALPFFPFSFVLFFVGVVPLPTAKGRDGALTPKTGSRVFYDCLNIVLKRNSRPKTGSISWLQTSKPIFRKF